MLLIRFDLNEFQSKPKIFHHLKISLFSNVQSYRYRYIYSKSSALLPAFFFLFFLGGGGHFYFLTNVRNKRSAERSELLIESEARSAESIEARSAESLSDVAPNARRRM